MTIKIGKVNLNGVQNVHTDENRNLVEQRVPNQNGGVFQDFGREPVSIILEGFLFGSEVLSDLETLRQAYEKLDPQPLTADIAIGTDLTEVIIEDFKVQQAAGYTSRYRFSIKLKEYTEPPKSQDQKDASVNEAVEADAEKHSANSMEASKALENPSELSGALEENPELLDHMSSEDLTDSIANNADQLSADDFGNSLSAVGALDPGKVEGMMTGLKEKGALGGFMEKFANAGRNLQTMLKNVNLTALAKGIVALFSVGTKLIGLIKKLWEDMQKVWNDMKNINLESGLEAFLKTAVEDLESLVESVTGLVHSLNEIMNALKPKDKSKPSPVSALKDFNCGATVINILDLITKTIEKIEAGLNWIGSQIIQLAGVSALLGMLNSIISGGFDVAESIGDQILEIGIADKESMDGLSGSLKGVGTLFHEILETGKTSIDSILSMGESLLSTDLDFKILPLKNEFGIFRGNLLEVKKELETPGTQANNNSQSIVQSLN